jgi:hypothetical protein
VFSNICVCVFFPTGTGLCLNLLLICGLRIQLIDHSYVSCRAGFMLKKHIDFYFTSMVLFCHMVGLVGGRIFGHFVVLGH